MTALAKSFIGRIINMKRRYCWIYGSMIGMSLIISLVFVPALSIFSAEGHPVKSFTDFDGDNKLDIILSDEKILLNNGDGSYDSNDIIFNNGVPKQRSYSLLNGTAIAADNLNAYYNISYMRIEKDEVRDSILLVTPGNLTVTIFAENDEGDFHPFKTLSFRNTMYRNLIQNFQTSALIQSK